MKEKSSTRYENELRNFLEKFRYLFKGGCETNENEYEDIILDMLEFAFDENDDINQLRIKGNYLLSHLCNKKEIKKLFFGALREH